MIYLRPASPVVALLFALSTRMVCHADSVTLAPIANATITQESPVPPNTRLDVGTNGKSQSSRSLFMFDIAGNIPSNAIITSVSLTVTVINVPISPVNSIFDLRAALVGWSEPNATWTDRLPGIPWSAPGGLIGTDFSNQISQTNYFGSSTGSTTFVSRSNLVADVQNWLQNPSANFGWVMISESEGTSFTVRGIASRENTTGPPSLLVQFSVPAMSPEITILSLTNNIFSFSFNAESNRTYLVQYSDDLSASGWNVLTNFSAAILPTNFVVSDILTSGNRFYRVQTP
jgi:hypothetical protein